MCSLELPIRAGFIKISPDALLDAFAVLQEQNRGGTAQAAGAALKVHAIQTPGGAHLALAAQQVAKRTRRTFCHARLLRAQEASWKSTARGLHYIFCFWC